MKQSKKVRISDDPQHNKIIDWIDHARDASTDWDLRACNRRNYREGKQWTQQERETIEKRGEPCLVDNLIHDKVTTLQGIEMQLRSDPRAFPRNPENDDGARAATQALRYIEEINNADQIFTKAGEYLGVEGTAAIECVVDKDSLDEGAPDIKMKCLQWDRLVLDPHSRELDFADARFIGYHAWMDRSEAAEKFGDEVAAELASYEDQQNFDREAEGDWWLDRRRDRVRIVYLYYKKAGDIYYCILQRAGFIKEPELSPYLDDRENTRWPIRARSAYITYENERYGEVERYLDPQDEVNKRRSKALHLLNSVVLIHGNGAVEDPELAVQELKKADGAVEVNGDQIDKVIDIQRNLELSTGHMQLLQLSLDRFTDIGPNSAQMGTESASGRSLQVQQQAGATRLGPHFDAIDDLKIMVYRDIWHLIKQFWTGPKWVRIMESDRDHEFIGLNQPAIDPETGQPVIDPNTGQPVINNPVPDIDVDIIVAPQPDVATLRNEQWEKLAAVPGIPPDLLIELGDFKDKERVLEHLRGESDDPQAQQQAQLQQAAQQLQMQAQEIANQLAQMQVFKTETEADENLAQVKKIEAETLMEVAGMNKPQPPQQ